MRLIAFILLIFTCSFLACQKVNHLTDQNYYSYYREDGSLKDEFWGEGENSDIPRDFEAVSVNKNGKEDGKGGDTHFDFLDDEVGVSYQVYDSSEIALQQLNKSIETSEKVIRKGSIKNEKGEEIGQKAVIVTKSKFNKSNYYALTWTRNSRFTILSGDSLKTIEAYEKDRKL